MAAAESRIIQTVDLVNCFPIVLPMGQSMKELTVVERVSLDVIQLDDEVKILVHIIVNVLDRGALIGATEELESVLLQKMTVLLIRERNSKIAEGLATMPETL